MSPLFAHESETVTLSLDHPVAQQADMKLEYTYR
jgi:hypothetical protein